MKKPLIGMLGMAFAVLSALPVHAYVPHTLRVGFAPWENPQDMAKTAAPMVEILTKATGMRVEPFLSTDYTGVVQAMAAGRVDVAFFPPAAYVLAEKKAHARVILKSQFAGRALYYSAIITRTDTGIKSLAQLKGRSFAFVDPTSASGAVYPKVLLKNAGINPERDFGRVIYAGGHDATVLAVVNGKADAGAVFANNPKATEAAWTKMPLTPAQRATVRVLAVSAPIPADNIAVADGLDGKLVTAIKKVFLDMSATPAGRARIKSIYKVDGFVEANPADYAPVREAFEKVGLTIH